MAELAQLLASIKLPDLSGKAVLITGASTGIGAAVARALRLKGSRSGCIAMPAANRRRGSLRKFALLAARCI